MATSFDATARISLDIRSFAQGAQAVTKSGGQMEQIFRNLNQVMGRVALVEEDLAKKLRSSLGVYNQITSAARSYAAAVAQLQKSEQAGANGAKLMTQAFQQLRSALSRVQGMSEKDYQRLQRTITLYERMANVIRQLAAAQRQMSAITQNAITAEQKAEQAKRKAEETARRLALEEQKLANQRERLAQSAARLALEEQRIAAARERAASATRNAAQAGITFSASTYAIRSSLGELEGAFQALLRTVARVPVVMAQAAISQEAAFAQTERVVGEAEAAAASLLQRFQEIAQNAPISFEEVSRIGQLGAQIGITASQLGDFTDTIVKFSLTTGVASEEATLLLGRIAQMQNVPISQMEQLGSAILALGTASVATDQEILRVNSSIATASNLFGLTAQETAGLSAALASLQVRPELSRGALTRVFNELTSTVMAGGVELEKLAKVMGMTDKEVTKLFNNPATRGDFLMAFISGLSQAAEVGGDVQGVLRELGVNAVRDIDVFSRLANNVDIVRDSFDRANAEFARGTELTRQSKTIYETTAAELQNLSDAFKTLLATLGGPFAEGIGTLASGLSEVIEWFAHLGPVVPILGSLATAVALGGTAWLAYQVVLSKTIQSLIATKELQNNLGVSSLKLRTAINVYRNALQTTNATQSATTNSMRQLVASTDGLTAALARSQAGIRAQAAAAASSAAGLGAMSAANVAASRSLQNVAMISGITVGQFRQLNSAGVASALAMTNVSAANRNLAVTQSQVANASRVHAQQTSLSAAAMANMNASAVRAVPVMSTMSSSMRQAAQSGAQLGSGLAVVSQGGGKAATAFTRTAQATTQVGLAARAASFAFGPWGLALTTVAIAFGPLLGKMFDFRSEAERLKGSALAATGGTQALANAIEADTQAAVKAAGGLEKYNAVVRTGSQEALRSIGVYRTVSTAKDDMADADRRAAERARNEAKERIRSIEVMQGSVQELKRQAQGHGAGAEAARRYLKQIDAANKTVQESTRVLSENSAAIGDNTRQWMLDTTQALVAQSKLADGSEISAQSLDMLARSGVNVGSVLEQSLTDPQASLKTLDAALREVNKTANLRIPAGRGDLTHELRNQAAAAIRLRNFLTALRDIIQSENSEATKAALTNKLLKDALGEAGQSAQSMSGNVKLTRESLAELDTTAEQAQTVINELGKAFEGFGTPMTAFEEAAKSAFKDAEDAIDKFSLKSKSGLNAYLKELEKIAKAQREWSANLIKISATLGPDIAEQFRKLGPQAAPAVAELADLSAKELEKLGPRLREIGDNATSDLAASIIQNSGKVKNASLQARTVIADVFGNAIDDAKTAKDFAKISTEYSKLIQQLNKSKVKIDISADDAKAFKSLKDISTYIDLVNAKKVKPEVAIDIIGAQGDIEKIQAIIAEAEKSGKLNPKGRAELNSILFQAQLTQLTSFVDTLEKEKKLDAKGESELTDAEYRAKVLALTEFLASKEGAGLLNPKGKAQLDDKGYRAQMEALAGLILGKEAAGEFDVNGDGKLSTSEFKKLLEALKRAVRDANNGKLDPKGRVTLAGTGSFRSQLNGIVQAAWSAGNRITNALNRSATVSVGYYYYQKNSPPRTGYAATGGWINGPGGPTADRVPMMLSDGEFVVNAAAARRFGALLEVINNHGGRGFSGVARKLLNSAPQNKSVQLSSNTGSTLMNRGLVQRAAPESVAASTARFAAPQSGPTNVFTIYNQYPQAEPTSVTINRSLAYAATIGGV